MFSSSNKLLNVTIRLKTAGLQYDMMVESTMPIPTFKKKILLHMLNQYGENYSVGLFELKDLTIKDVYLMTNRYEAADDYPRLQDLEGRVFDLKLHISHPTETQFLSLTNNGIAIIHNQEEKQFDSHLQMLTDHIHALPHEQWPHTLMQFNPNLNHDPENLLEFVRTIPTLVHLDMAHFELGDNRLKELMLTLRERPVRSLNLSCCQLTENSSTLLAFIAKMPTLTQLNLTGNNLSESALIEIFDSLENHPALVELNLSGTALMSNSVQKLSQVVPSITQLKVLNVTQNNLDLYKSSANLFMALEKNRLLTDFIINDYSTSLPKDMVAALNTLLEINRSITHIGSDIDKNPFLAKNKTRQQEMEIKAVYTAMLCTAANFEHANLDSLIRKSITPLLPTILKMANMPIATTIDKNKKEKLLRTKYYNSVTFFDRPADVKHEEKHSPTVATALLKQN